MDAATVAAGSAGAGMGITSTRWVLCAVWGLGILTAVIDARLGRPSVASPLAFATLLGGVWAISTPGTDVLGRGRALLVIAGALATVTVVATTGPAQGRTWLVDLSGYLLALLVARGNGRTGAAGFVAFSAILMVWVAQGGSQAPLGEVLGAPVLALAGGVVWHLVLRRAVTRERAHRSEAARAASDARIARRAVDADRLEIAAINDVVAPVLRRILDGGVPDAASRLDAAVAEATVRDRIRSPWEPGGALDLCVEDRRRAGIVVVQIGERTGPRAAMPSALADRLVAIVAPVRTGRVTVRTLPPGRGVAMTVVVDDGATVSRTAVSIDGTVVDESRHGYSGQMSGT
ncbi:hypothetical protein [Sanguibacter sp. HDW7]|uniref:hypothetical protein n=1 Tax=Sanguibacter sp. HDW7 TaxID=2714931 RepID=UPI001409644D|nr:hypothetical protein [Sanguibacter sp. HDW7]QIK82451.1 hypothetical protein G7063_01590 [Sanguibacter sp. HDW7]